MAWGVSSVGYSRGLIILWSLVQVQHALPGWIKKVRYRKDSGLFVFSVCVAVWLPFEGGNRAAHCQVDFRLVRVIRGRRSCRLLRSAQAIRLAVGRMAAAHRRPAVRQVATEVRS